MGVTGANPGGTQSILHLPEVESMLLAWLLVLFVPVYKQLGLFKIIKR